MSFRSCSLSVMNSLADGAFSLADGLRVVAKGRRPSVQLLVGTMRLAPLIAGYIVQGLAVVVLANDPS